MSFTRPPPSAVTLAFPPGASYTAPAGGSINAVFPADDYTPSSDFVIDDSAYTASSNFVEGGYTAPVGNGITAEFAGPFTRPAPSAVVLKFGTGAATPPPPPAPVITDVELVAHLPLPTFTAQVRRVVAVDFVAVLPLPSFVCEARYVSNTARPTVGQLDTGWQETESLPAGSTTGQQDAVALPHGWENPWRLGVDVRAWVQHKLPDLFINAYQGWATGFQQGTTYNEQRHSVFQQGDKTLRPNLTTDFQQGTKAQSQTLYRHQDGDKTQRAWVHSKVQNATPLHKAGVHDRFQKGTPFTAKWESLYEEAMRPLPGISYPPPPPPPPGPDWTCYEPSTALLFDVLSEFSTPNLLFLCDGDVAPPPPQPPLLGQKVYFIVNSLSLKRVDDNTPIIPLSASVGIDRSSWCWSFSATLPYSEREKIDPDIGGPVEVELEINSNVWRFLVEDYNIGEEFGKTTISVRGRSLTAYLGEVYAPTRSYVQGAGITARALAEDALTYAGVPTGYTIDWNLGGLLGWELPAGAVSYSNLTPVQIVQLIATGGGGYVNSHPSAKQLLVRADYPVPFWGWAGATVNKTIPKSLVTSRSLQWLEKPAYNGVYVSGQNVGVNDLIRRNGTAGDYLAPMVVDQMIGDSVASALRGTSILSAGGKQASVGLSVPLHASLGVLTPGMLIEVVNGGFGTEPAWRGLIRGVSISAAWNRSLKINQSVEVERHYGDIT